MAFRSDPMRQSSRPLLINPSFEAELRPPTRRSSRARQVSLDGLDAPGAQDEPLLRPALVVRDGPYR